MAFKKQTKVGDTFKIILKSDDAIPSDLSDESYDTYLSTLDETALSLVGEPTRFVLKRDISFNAQKQIASDQMGLDSEGKAQVRMGFVLEEVRASLVGIENPEALLPEEKILFKKDSDGLACKELVSMLHSMGVVMSLYGARQKVIAPASNQKKI